VAKKIGLYGGTFDPIHYAHLILARDAMEKLELEQIIFVPAAISPHKLEQQPTAAQVRVEMLRAAIEGEARFMIDELELNRPPPSFTIDTIEEYKRRHSDLNICYLIGSDNLPGLKTWHRIDDLRQLVRFVVLDRAASPAHSEFQIIRRHIDISATELRKRVASGHSIRYLVPPAVEEIICRRQLYQEPPE